MKSTEAICDQAIKLVRNHKSWRALLCVTQTQEAPTECLPLFSCLWSIFVGWGANHRSCTTYFNFFLFVISNLSLFPWQLFQSSMTLIDSELKYVLTDITRSGDLCLYSKACPDTGNLANSEALASEDTRPILPRPTLKQKFSFSAPV